MAIYVYNSTTGELYSWCPNDTDPVTGSGTLYLNGMDSVSGLPALDATHVWDASRKTVVTMAAATLPNWIETYQFILLFTPAEHAAIVASTDHRVRQFMMAVQTAHRINLNDRVMQDAMHYLVGINLISSANAALILSGKPSQ